MEEKLEGVRKVKIEAIEPVSLKQGTIVDLVRTRDGESKLTASRYQLSSAI